MFLERKYNFSIVVVIVVITAALSSSGVYIWQKLSCKELTEKATMATERRLQKQIFTLQQKLTEIRSAPQTYTIYPGPKYVNEKYGFTMNIPEHWFAIEHKDKKTGRVDIMFGNDSYKNNFLTPPNAGENALFFSLLIVPKNDSKDSLFYQEEFYTPKRTELEKAFSEGIIEKARYDVGKHKILTLYLITRMDERWPLTWDKILPDLDAFIEDEQYLYYFSIPDYIPNNRKGKKEAMKIFRDALGTFRFK